MTFFQKQGGTRARAGCGPDDDTSFTDLRPAACRGSPFVKCDMELCGGTHTVAPAPDREKQRICIESRFRQLEMNSSPNPVSKKQQPIYHVPWVASTLTVATLVKVAWIHTGSRG